MAALLCYIALITVAAGLDVFVVRRPSRRGRRVVAAAEQFTAAAARALLAADNRITIALYELTAPRDPTDQP